MLHGGFAVVAFLLLFQSLTAEDKISNGFIAADIHADPDFSQYQSANR